jgi:hypothetical protein
MCFRVWEEEFEDGSKMVAKGVFIALENKTCTINLSMFVAFEGFIAFSSYPTIGKE